MHTKRSKSARPCLHCSQPFVSSGGGAQGRAQRFCSRRCAYDHRKRPPAERFWAFVDKSGECWLWTGGIIGGGYGGFEIVKGDKTVAHRYAWELLRGPVPDGLQVCHNCPGGDNPACVNPGHMFLGTALDNARDAVRKGRYSRGERQGSAKLTEEQVRAIRTEHAAGKSGRALARQFGVSKKQIQHVVRRKHWRHVL